MVLKINKQNNCPTPSFSRTEQFRQKKFEKIFGGRNKDRPATDTDNDIKKL